MKRATQEEQSFRESFYGTSDGIVLDEEDAYEADAQRYREELGIGGVVAREKRVNRTARAFFADVGASERKRSQS